MTSPRKKLSQIVAAIAMATVALIVFWFWRCPDRDLYSSVGTVDSTNAAIRASIRKLSNECKRCPKVNQYRVHWTVKSNDVILAQSTTLYDRSSHAIGL